MTTLATSLSANDNQVLSKIFDPESTTPTTQRIDSSLPPLPHLSSSLLSTLQSQEHAAIASLNSLSPSSQIIQTAISALTTLITAHPTYPSAYNNRAQARRLLLSSSNAQRPNLELQTSILIDLNTAITLASPGTAQEAISPHRQLVLSAAHAHRADIIYRIASHWPIPSSAPGREEFLAALPADVKVAREKTEVEEAAGNEFSVAGRYGSEVGREMGKMLNPYARLCGGIVGEVLGREISGVGNG
ncbi:MAG: hypothetical protein L6R41_002509 [Letrouitia leprolyta]|nr:MAG: hypothetical protein L6R41_002509 [Letrouitia leprolyta]